MRRFENHLDRLGVADVKAVKPKPKQQNGRAKRAKAPGPAPQPIEPAVEFDLPAISRELGRLAARGTGVLRVLLPAEIEITLGLERIGPDAYRALAQLGGEAFLEEVEEPAELAHLRELAKCRLRRRTPCAWQAADAGADGPGECDLDAGAMARMDCYLDWVVDRLLADARAKRGRTAAPYVTADHVDAAARAILDPCPVFDAQGDQVGHARPKQR